MFLNSVFYSNIYVWDSVMGNNYIELMEEKYKSDENEQSYVEDSENELKKAEEK